MKAFRAYTAALVGVAVAVVAAVAPLGWGNGADRLTFVLLAVATLLGELLPVSVPRRGSTEQVTMSSAFALAILFAFGPMAAIAVYVAASIVTDVAGRVAPVKVAFNAAHYTVSIGAATAVLALAGALPPALVADHLGAAVAAAVAFFVVDNTAPAIGSAILAGDRWTAALTHEAAFHLWTTGALVALAPVVATAAETSVWLVPLLIAIAWAIWAGGRQAAVGSRRSLYDDLTGLPNRALLLLDLEQRIERGEATATVAVVDVDDFTAVNDAFGHAHGDALLREVAQRLRSALGPHDLMARLGGDEFALVRIAPDERVANLAEVVEKALAQPFQIGELALEMRARCGLACFPRDGHEPNALLTRAGAALQRAKARHVPWARHDAEREDASLDRLVLAGQLRRGIERSELEVHYQPKLATRPDGVNGVEALVRWRHPDLGMVQPDGFIPLAERVGLIDKLTAFVLERALEQCARWRADGLELRVGVNLSPRNLLDADLPAAVADALARNRVPPHLLQLELTESTMVDDLPLASRALEHLRAIGVRIAIDDFGTGHSSLTQLRKLPIDEIKIDKSFVFRMETDADDAAIVASTLALGRNLGLDVTAEGVESATACATLARLGCDFVQGYHLSPPVPATQCAAVIDRLLTAGPERGARRLFSRERAAVPAAP